jgi:CubicO group peptidase (beta-lactamase class C family)
MPPDLPRALAEAGFRDGTPVAVAVSDADGAIADACSGRWPDGSPVEPADRFYLASLAKQLTGAAAALLVRDGLLDPNAAVATYLPDLPAWAAIVTVEQLAHHTAGLPAASALEADVRGGHWTSAHVLDALRRLTALPHPPGAAHVYSNAGYILLAHLVAQVSGLGFADLVTRRLLLPHGLAGMRYVTEPHSSYAQPALMGPMLPLSVGDGGLWSTARDFARWLQLMNRDVFGIADIVTSPGRLVDGSPVDYGWGIGLRSLGGRPLYTHGGSWRGAAARAVRMPDPGLAVVALAADDHPERLITLVDRLLGALAG